MKQSTKSYIFISFLIFMINNDLVWKCIEQLLGIILKVSNIFMDTKKAIAYYPIVNTSYDFFVCVISIVWVIFTTVIIVKELIRLVRFIMKKTSKNH